MYIYTIHDKSTQEDMACFQRGKKIGENKKSWQSLKAAG